ncbi:MAG: response regulator transcription factor [Thermoleophilaceae bacterium]|nr:response regulator transcription factor [Thermoleophilaceae bacterium]
MPGERIRVVLCDDHAEYRLLIRLALEEDPRIRVVGEAEDGRRGVELIAQLRPDVCLLDLSMPELGGLEALPLIREGSPETKIIVLSGFSREGITASSAIDRDAHAYLEKGESLDGIRRAVLEAAEVIGG